MTASTGLYACLYVKEFPAQSMLRLRPELRVQPCVVMEGEPPQEYAYSLNTKARKLGMAAGMTRVEVETFPAISVLSRSRMEEEAAKAALLECSGAFSPRLEAGGRDRAFFCVLDIAGTEKLFGPPTSLAKSLLNRVRALGIGASIAISSNFHAAGCLARAQALRMGVSIIPQGAESNTLSSLPLAVLDLSEEHAETFSLWGIRTLGMLAALPEKELISRLGQEGKRLRQLALGQRLHLFRPLESAFSLEERMELDTSVEQLEALLFVVNVLLDQLIVRAASRTLALASVHLALSLEDKSSHLRTVRPALPTNDRQLWLKLLQLDLEAHPPQAPILSLTLTGDLVARARDDTVLCCCLLHDLRQDSWKMVGLYD